MTRMPILILICVSVLFMLFQNFTVPTRVLPIQETFESGETNPTKRFRDYLKFRVGKEPFEKIERMKSKLRIEMGDSKEEIAEVGNREPSSEIQEDPMKYNFSNLTTLRVRDQNTEIRCKVESDGLNLVFQQQLNPTASYSIEHNTEQHKSHAKIQFSW
jgi:hypothetical protein